MGPLAERSFVLVFLARAISELGDEVAPIAVTFGVLDQTGSTSDLGFVLAARTILFILFVLVGGVWGDRVSRKRLMVSSDLARLATQALFGFLLLDGSASVWSMVLLQAANGTATAMFRPAAEGLIPAIVSARHLQGANAYLTFSYSGTRIIGPALAGVLIVAFGPGWGILLDAASFGASALFLAFVRVPAQAIGRVRTSFVTDLRAGWAAVRSRTWVWMGTLLGMGFLFLLSALMVIGPVIARHSLGGATAWTLIVSAMGVGSVIGSIIGLRVRFARPLVVGNCAVTLLAVPMMLLALTLPVGLIAAGAAVAGSGMSICNILYSTARQEHIPPDILSRVTGFLWLGSSVLSPLGYAVAGPVAAAVGTGPTLAGAAALLTVIMLGGSFIPAMRSFGIQVGGRGAEPSATPEPD